MRWEAAWTLIAVVWLAFLWWATSPLHVAVSGGFLGLIAGRLWFYVIDDWRRDGRMR